MLDGIAGVGPKELSRLDIEDAGVGDLEQEKRSRWREASCKSDTHRLNFMEIYNIIKYVVMPRLEVSIGGRIWVHKCLDLARKEKALDDIDALESAADVGVAVND